MFNSVIDGVLTLESVSICVFVAVILGLLIAYIHMITSKYSKNFVITLAILPLLVAVVIMMVNGNLGTSVAILGAFGLVRFRSLPGTSKEIASVFFTMTIGLAIGMGQVIFAGLVTILVGILLIFLNKTNFGEEKNKPKILNIAIPEDLDYIDVFKDIFDKYVNSYEIIKVNTANLGSIYELRYEVILKNDIKEQDFINDLRVKNGNLKISLHLARNDDAL